MVQGKPGFQQVELREGPRVIQHRQALSRGAAGLPAVGIGMGMPGYQIPAECRDRVETWTLVAVTQLVVLGRPC
jgi:hypothetical protein